MQPRTLQNPLGCATSCYDNNAPLMSRPAGNTDGESHTSVIGAKRQSIASVRGVGRRRLGHRDLRDFVPKGGSFAAVNTTMIDEEEITGSDSSTHSVDSVHTHALPVAMTWNKGTRSTIRTSLRGGTGDMLSLGRNRLAIGFSSTPQSVAPSASTKSNSQNPTGNASSPDEVIEISDDSDIEDDSDEGGMMINLEAQSSSESPAAHGFQEQTDMSDGEVVADIEAPSLKAPIEPQKNTTSDVQMQTQGTIERSRSQKLADLTPDDLEKQIRYTLFHLDRDQIDLSRSVICTTCLREGHMEASCPEIVCFNCGAHNNHSSRMCPTFLRCLKCRERGHDLDSCQAKLRNNSVPCDYCGGGHLEDVCSQRFFPALRPSSSNGEVKLWISCCECASKTHLVGDCRRVSTKMASRWSLSSLDPNKVLNMSFESGTRKMEQDAENRGMRPQGLKIKGRADHRHSPQRFFSEDADEQFLRPRVGGRNTSPRRSNIRFNTDRAGRADKFTDFDSDRRGGSDTHFQSHDYQSSGRYESTSDYRDRSGVSSHNSFDDDRRRSRSPFRGDTWRPPLPKEPLPTRPPSQQVNQARISQLPHRPPPSNQGYASGQGTRRQRHRPSRADNQRDSYQRRY